jgi:hypothetical protein
VADIKEEALRICLGFSMESNLIERRKNMKQRNQTTVMLLVIVVAMAFISGTAFSADKPNILVIWGDDIGGFNISANNQGMMGYKTPNIDRIAKEGALFTDW